MIDVGTNSTKFHVGERTGDGTWRRLVDRAEMTRLGEGLAERGEIWAEATERTAIAIADMVEEAKRNGVLRLLPWARLASHRSQQRIGRRGDPLTHGHFDRGDPRRRGRPPGLPRSEGGTGFARRLTGRVRHRRRQHPVHVRAGSARRRAVQPRRGCRRYANGLGSLARFLPVCCARRSQRSLRICRGSMAVRRRTHWWRWVARSPTSPQ